MVVLRGTECDGHWCCVAGVLDWGSRPRVCVGRECGNLSSSVGRTAAQPMERKIRTLNTSSPVTGDEDGWNWWADGVNFSIRAKVSLELFAIAGRAGHADTEVKLTVAGKTVGEGVFTAASSASRFELQSPVAVRVGEKVLIL